MPGSRLRQASLRTPDGAVVEYGVLGAGSTPVLSIPGANDGARTLRGTFSALLPLYRRYPPTCRVLLMRRRAPLPDGFTARAIARDYAQAIEALRLGPVHVEALSAGGGIGLWLALDRPDLVRSLLLLSTTAHADVELKGVVRRWIAWTRAGRRYALQRDSLRRMLPAEQWRRLRPLLPLFWLRSLLTQDRLRLQAVLAAACDFDLRPELARITCPTLVLGGTADGLVRPALQDALAAGIPGARQVLLPGHGHLASVEAPAEHLRQVRYLHALAEWALRD